MSALFLYSPLPAFEEHEQGKKTHFIYENFDLIHPSFLISK